MNKFIVKIIDNTGIKCYSITVLIDIVQLAHDLEVFYVQGKQPITKAGIRTAY